MSNREMLVYSVQLNLETCGMVARDLAGRELARVAGDTADHHAELARKAAETLASWYN
jgi:hypothetical protein